MLPNAPAPMVPNASSSGGGGGTPGGSSGQLQWNSSSTFAGVSGSTVDSNGSIVLGGATVTTSDPVISITQTWNAGGITFTGIKSNITNTASANGSAFLDLQVAGASKISAGVVQSGSQYILALGGLTSSGAGFRLDSGPAIGVVLADASAYCTLNVGALSTQAGGSVTAGGNFYLNNNTGLIQVGAAADPSLARAASNVLEINNGTKGTLTGTFFQWGGQARVTSDFTVTSSTALTNITGLSVTLSAGRTYSFEAQLFITDAAAGGVQAAIAGTCTATAIQYTGWAVADNAIKGKTNATALATAVASTLTTETTGIMVQIYGTITVNAAGTLTVQLAQNTSNGTATTAKRGSTFYVYDMQ